MSTDYRSHLPLFFEPEGVAVIGASRDPDKLGYDAVVNLKNSGYGGAIYPVNPKAESILGLPCYADIHQVPDPLDLAMILLPAPYVVDAVDACGQRGVKAITICSGGFRETGAEGEHREEQIKALAAEYGMAIIGPNCIGTLDVHTPVNATFMPMFPTPGEIMVLSQSGALTVLMIEWSRQSGVGLSRAVSLGNQAVVSETDLLPLALQDEETRVIAAYLEGIQGGPEFVKVAGEVSRQMPIVALKAGRASGGVQAVSSHTGALAGSDAAYDAAFRRAGVLRADTLEQMFDWAHALAWQPLPRGNRVAVLTNAGGLGVLAVDALEANGMQLAPLTDATRAFLRDRVQAAASVDNPVDILAAAGPTTYALCLDALMRDETVDAVVVMTPPQDWFDPISLAEVVAEISNGKLGSSKPILTVISEMGDGGTVDAVFRHKRVPNYPFPSRLGATLGAMYRRAQWLEQATADDTVELLPLEVDREAAAMAVEAGLKDLNQSGGWMDGGQVEALLSAYSIPTPRSGLAPNIYQAVKLSRSIGYPLVMKLSAEGLVHKTDLGGVIVGIEDEGGLRTAFDEMMNRARSAPELTVVNGVLLQHMERGVLELIAGVVRDPAFGPLVMAGLGGTEVELRRDVAFELAPLSDAQAGRLLERTSAGIAIAGFRGRPAGDRGAVIETLRRLAQLAADHPAIAEIEINPLIVKADGDGVSAVDVRVRLAQG